MPKLCADGEGESRELRQGSKGFILTGSIHLIRTHFGFFPFWNFPNLQVRGKKRLKKFSKKVKKGLDKILFYAIVSGIEKCAPT